jgi:hypothetical protein
MHPMADRLFLRLADDPLYAPETTVPVGTMHEFAVPPGLAPYVANAMAYEERLPAGAQPCASSSMCAAMCPPCAWSAPTRRPSC